jgi:hypothetical protein
VRFVRRFTGGFVDRDLLLGQKLAVAEIVTEFVVRCSLV